MSTTRRELDRLFSQVDKWFEILNNPIAGDEDTGDETNSCADDSESQLLDSLAKDLELLLEDDEDTVKTRSKSETETNVYFFESYACNERALLDDTIGLYLTVLDHEVDNASSSSKGKNREITVTLGHVPSGYKQHQGNKCNEDDLSEAPTSTPIDHDYLPKPRARPLVVSNKLIQRVRSNKNQSSILSTEALKRFAKFSNEFRVLSLKSDRRLAVTDS